MIAMQEIQNFASRIAEHFGPERIVLFGSYARGDFVVDSDVDMLVVLPFEGKTWRVASEIRKRARPSFPLDLLVRTPEQLNEHVTKGDAFWQEVIQQGKVLYEARS
ncbi:MAG TPA: nucleotidyltransferase domain-containing protein [Anaerolineae bacterium]|nr:nucleotidyltransferase domain-containing protein [Anaerolineae bacterium]HQI85282.1 nucleotidyltransferase domain-containing protein [Anaerolineae bacterium]